MANNRYTCLKKYSSEIRTQASFLSLYTSSKRIYQKVLIP
ncbi:hypothetical protein HMPREF1869_00634 [Bacteroidales bacterium KA00251]|nr:hypothetical protein HMPREF1869_00634 [Bacteroidales bacterium KA00251]